LKQKQQQLLEKEAKRDQIKANIERDEKEKRRKEGLFRASQKKCREIKSQLEDSKNTREKIVQFVKAKDGI